MRILANATDNIWQHHVGAIHVLQQIERGVVGIQDCKDQNGILRRDIVFVEGSKNQAKIVRRGIVGGYSLDGDGFEYLIFWTNASDDEIVSAQTLADAKSTFEDGKILTEIIDLALDTFENFLQQFSTSKTQ